MSNGDQSGSLDRYTPLIATYIQTVREKERERGRGRERERKRVREREREEGRE